MFGGWFQRAVRAGRVMASAALVSACASAIQNDPVNQRLALNPREAEAELAPAVETNYDDMVVALSFSGGGMRAAAFSYGVLEGFDQTRVPTRAGAVSLLDRLDFLSGVSGGSILAAYYGLKGRAAIADFRQRFLLVNAEEALQTDLSLGNIARAHSDPNAPPLIKSYADALGRYRSGTLNYVKLLDGGLVDNFGLAGFTIARLAANTPFGPLAPQQAVKLRRFLFLVVDAGRAP